MSAPSDNIDYEHTSNVARMHAAVAREKNDPVAAPTPIPITIIAAITAIGMIAGSYFGGNTGTDFSAANIKGYDYPSKYDGVSETTDKTMDPKTEHEPNNWIAAGKALYANNCNACHQATGQGVAGTFPPLAGSEFVIKGEKQLIAILLHGLGGPLTVNGKGYNGQMPPQGGKSNKDIAQLVSYVRNDWGNKASVVYEDQVAAVRKELGARSVYTETEIRALGENENAPPSEWPAKLSAPAGAPAAASAAAPAPAAP
jgi:mono/diheme cytochrome c family protein